MENTYVKIFDSTAVGLDESDLEGSGLGEVNLEAVDLDLVTFLESCWRGLGISMGLAGGLGQSSTL